MSVPRRIAVLMLHDVVPGETASGYGVGDAWLARVAALAAEPESVEAPVPLHLTFDDGCEGTFRYAAPVLHAAGISATLFVTVEFVGRRGFVDAAMLREWVGRGFVVGSHGVTHRPLNLMDEAVARGELVDSRARLEDWTGSPVDTFAYPGGNDARRLHRLARQVGYRAVYTSRPGFAAPDQWVRPRFTARAGTPLRAVQSLRRGGIPREMWRDAVLWSAKKVVGTGPYRAVRRLLRGGA